MNSSAGVKLPHFVIIGAMKSATTTIYEQLRLLDGVYMPELKEPNFFSDDSQYQQGLNWYLKLFEPAKDTDIIGEASTHYTKIPIYPNTLKRMSEVLPSVKIIYIMRDPIDRLISQYIHEWSCNNIHDEINRAVNKFPELIRYSCYAEQLKPFIDQYGVENILPVFFERIKKFPEDELVRIAKFIGYKGHAQWRESVSRANVSSERLRTNKFTNFLITNPILAAIRNSLIPHFIRDSVKSKMRMNNRPELTKTTKSKLEIIFNDDLSKLGTLLGITLTSDNYKSQVITQSLEWKIKKEQKMAARKYEY
ncbi:sulfotransferase domain-containing protein [Microbulbifer bruguierae]|uniref:Sulfotransferase domain-containing protein n=1 Tax=Microbulbifer bruguierae TaxID=3029061 RepID=A0ABY8NBT8_9GAMM|nr:sulfotransferase domain-containing protein [Microbulbifer bruguierae]WGL15257.1 sulfotransferase domain-containing protein [Microbulbifer bruguierae]